MKLAELSRTKYGIENKLRAIAEDAIRNAPSFSAAVQRFEAKLIQDNQYSLMMFSIEIRRSAIIECIQKALKTSKHPERWREHIDTSRRGIHYLYTPTKEAESTARSIREESIRLTRKRDERFKRSIDKAIAPFIEAKKKADAFDAIFKTVKFSDGKTLAEVTYSELKLYISDGDTARKIKSLIDSKYANPSGELNIRELLSGEEVKNALGV